MTFAGDLRHAARALAHRPLHTTVALAVLAVGIATATGTFSIVNGAVFRPLPQADASRLVTPVTTSAGRVLTSGSVSYPQYLEFRAAAELFDRVALVQWNQFHLTGVSESELLPGAWVSDAYFGALQVRPVAGRTISAADFGPQAARTVVLSERLWRRRFGGDPACVGRSIVLDGTPYTVVGVVGTDALWPSYADAWIPLNIQASFLKRIMRFDLALFECLARLRPGVSIERARARIEAIGRRQALDHPDLPRTYGTTLVPLRDRLIAPSWRLALLVLLGAVVFVLLLACANVANLLIVRAIDCRRDLAIKLALGATRLGASRHLVLEALLLALLGGALGLLLHGWLVTAVVRVGGSRIPGVGDAGPDRVSVLFGIAASLLTTLTLALIAGFSAAVASRSDDMVINATHGQVGSAPGRRARFVLVAVEVALSVVLLVGAGLMVRSFAQLLRVDPGFGAAHLAVVEMRIPFARYRTAAAGEMLRDRLRESIERVPGVASITVASSLPGGAGGMYFQRPLVVNGQPDPPASRDERAQWAVVMPGHFRTLGIALLHGRDFDDRDTEDAVPAIVLNQALAGRLFPDTRNPVGRQVRAWQDEKAPRQVVGIVGNVRHLQWTDEAGPVAYVPQRQFPVASGMIAVRLVPSAAGREPQVLNAIRQRMHAIDPDIAVLQARSMTEAAAAQTRSTRFSMSVMLVFAGAGWILAIAGLYGVVSYGVARRAHEFGVRTALGAVKTDLVRLAGRQALGPLVLGLAIGTAGAIAFGRVISGLLYEVAAADPLTFAAIDALFALTALAACAIPAWRGGTVDAITILRSE